MLNIIFEDEEGLLKPSESDIIIKAASEAFLNEGKSACCAVFAVDEESIRGINREYRNTDYATDVLSFPAVERDQYPYDGFYGDILICPGRAYSQAAEYGHSYERELAFLAIHGVLHLLGYDHETNDDEVLMRKKQTTILERMGL